MTDHLESARQHLRTAVAALEDAAYHLGESGRDDAALLAQQCDEAVADVRAVLSVVARRAA